MRTIGTDLFDERAHVADHYLGLSVWAELLREQQAAEFCANRANFIDAELRRSVGL